MEVDIACAGFGPAMGGFLTTLTQAWNENPADPAFESRVTPGMPLQVLCYERADDICLRRQRRGHARPGHPLQLS